MEGREKWRGNESNLHDKKVEHFLKKMIIRCMQSYGSLTHPMVKMTFPL